MNLEGERKAMGFDKRTEATKYKPKEGDTLKKIAERETASGNPITASDLAKFNWGTDLAEIIEEYLRDELGCYKRDAKKRFMISADCEMRNELLIPRFFTRSALAIDRIHKLWVKAKPAPPEQFQGCTMVKGIHFEFDCSFVRPSVVDDLKALEQELKKYPDAKMMIFGHTDKVGPDPYNKKLSERRAKSTYAFITNQPDLWEELYQAEKWGLKVIQEILKDMGGDYEPGPVTGINGPQTETAVENFQRDNGLVVDGVAGPKTRNKLFSSYMTGKHDIKIDNSRFMYPKYMGCGEYNPVVKTEKKCEANRRVTFYLFNKDRLPVLPCKYESLEPCKKRLNSRKARSTPSSAWAR